MGGNFWFYTFSTIAQTLAAVIGLAAAFAVFKLNDLTNKISERRKHLRRFILLLTSPTQKEIEDIERLNNAEFYKEYTQALETLNSNKENLGLSEEMFTKFRKEMERIIVNEWNSYFTAKPTRIYNYLLMRKEEFEKLIKSKNKSLSSLGTSLLVVNLVITASLLLLPKFDFIGSPVAVDLLVIAAVISIFFTAFSVFQMAKSEI